MQGRRPYRMTTRAAAAAATAERILAAMEHEFVRRRYEDITLADVAQRAGVTLQTVLRRFGSKDGLLAASAKAGLARVIAERAQAPDDDVPAAIANLFDHYEKDGGVALKLLEQEHLPQLAPVTRRGRAIHHEWVSRVFARQLASLLPKARALRRGQLIAVTDVYLWKILRDDLRLDRAAAQASLLDLIETLTRRGRR
jgi:AcrR family transcriptional regulator